MEILISAKCKKEILEQTFHHRRYLNDYKHLKTSSISFVIRKCKIILLEISFYNQRISWNEKIIPSVCKKVRQLELSYSTEKDVTCYNYFRKPVVSTKAECIHTLWPAIVLLGIISYRTTHTCEPKYMYRKGHSNKSHNLEPTHIFVNSKMDQ